jgi:microcystin-dependent protein
VFLLGAGDRYTGGEIGGESSHTLVHKELPTLEGEIIMHHAAIGTNIAGAGGCFSGDSIVQGKYRQGGTLLDADTVSIGKINYTNSGENKPHNNMPPYLAVYMWKRIL